MGESLESVLSDHTQPIYGAQWCQGAAVSVPLRFLATTGAVCPGPRSVVGDHLPSLGGDYFLNLKKVSQDPGASLYRVRLGLKVFGSGVF